MNALFSLFLVVLTVTTITAQCPNQASITNTTQDRDPAGKQQITRSLFINRTLAEQPSSGLIKDAIISTVGNNVPCGDIVLLGLRGEFGDGISWGTIADFVINAATIAPIATAYDNAIKLPLPNTITPAFRSKFPSAGNSLNVIQTSDVSSFWINSVVIKNRQSGIQVIAPNGKSNQNSTGVAPQPCQVSEWSECDGCKQEKQQIVTRRVIAPAVGGGRCPATQMSVYCDRKCLTDWQIGLIALACFLFLVACCICVYCCCVRNRRRDDYATQRAQQKEKELAMPPPAQTTDDKIDVEVVEPVRPSTQYEEPAFHRGSAETVNTVTTGPRPTATFHDDDDIDKPTPSEAKEEEAAAPAPVAAPAAGAPRANVVRVHL